MPFFLDVAELHYKTIHRAHSGDTRWQAAENTPRLMGSKALWEVTSARRCKCWIILSFTSHNLRPIVFPITKKEVLDLYSSREGYSQSDQGMHFQLLSFSSPYLPLRRFLSFLSQHAPGSHECR